MLEDIIIKSIYGWRWWSYASARARCTFAVSILLLLDASFINCNSSARALATILESCKFPRTIAELLSSLILYSTVCVPSTTTMHFYRNLAYMPKSQRISDNQCTLYSTLAYLFLAENSRIQMRSFVHIKRRVKEEQAAWQFNRE